MNANITMHELWWNPSVRGFFFRTQSKNTLEELARKAERVTDVLDCIDAYAEEGGYDIDDIEEMLYNDTIEELAEEFGIELNEED